eukprot:jgi/Mesvir1/13518/Mv26025-RA.1
MAETVGEVEKDANGEELRTLFVSGLPVDVKDREIYNLFRHYAGYVDSQIKMSSKSPTPVAFAVFENQAAALAAKQALNGSKFDPDIPHIELRLELAKSNSRVKKRPVDGTPGGMAKRGRPGGLLPGQVASDAFPGAPFNPLGGLPLATGGFEPNLWNMPSGNAPGGFGGFSGGMNAPLPCNTLFVANLSAGVSEATVHDAFARMQGFQRLKLTNKGRDTSAFVEFADVACSTQAMNLLQNPHNLPAVLRGLRVEYAKSPMGSRGPPLMF